MKFILISFSVFGLKIECLNSTYSIIIIEMEKTCHTCKAAKPVSDFWKAVKSVDGLNWSCKSCIKIRRIELSKSKSVSQDANTKICRGCKQAKPFTEFYAEKKGTHGLKGKCKQCYEQTKQVYRIKQSIAELTNDENQTITDKNPINIVKNSVPNKRCPESQVLKVSPIISCVTRTRYNRINEYVKSKGCRLLTSIEDVEVQQLKCNSFYDIIAICGHKSRIRYDMFKAQNCGMRCMECTRELNAKMMKKRAVTFSNVEYQGFCYLRKQLTDVFDVVKMVEGTRADFAIKIKTINENKWLPIQLKVTEDCGNTYGFKMNGHHYENMAVVLLCLRDKRLWMIDGNLVKNLQTINIGKVKSKYSEYEVVNACKTAEQFYNVFPLQELENINIPVGKQQQREQKYRRIRESYLPCIDFVYPEEEGLEYDFTVNNIKIQEKVASAVRNYYYICMSKRTLYQYGQNDFYWVNIPDSTIFFLIPQQTMLEKHLIAPKGVTIRAHRGLILNTTFKEKSSNNWLLTYMYDYATITQGKMLEMLTLNTGASGEI